MTEPRATVVIPTRMRAGSLRQVLVGLDSQDCAESTFNESAFEVIVVCDGLSDPAEADLKGAGFRFPLRIAKQDHKGPAAARNLGVSLARSGLVIFLDDDVIPSEGFVTAHLAAHRDGGDVAVAGPLLPPPGWGSPWTRFERDGLEQQYSAMAAGRWAMSPRQFYTGNASVGRDHLAAVGGFDEAFSRAEDVELAFRLQSAGLRFAFASGAQVVHLATRSYRSWLKAAYQYGRADAVMAQAKGRGDLVDAVVDEFHGRHPLTRASVLWSLRHPRAASVLTGIGRPLSSFALLFGLERLAVRVCSGAFNVEYWSGFAAELGSRSAALSLLMGERRVTRGARSSRPAASVILCTRNRNQQCLEAVGSVLASAPSGCEVIVVDQSDDDALRSALLRLPKGESVNYLKMPPRGLSAARNLASAEATGDYLLFTDDDCSVAGDWVEAWGKAFDSHPQAGLGFGRVEPGGDPSDADYTPQFPGDDGNYGPELFLRGEGRVGLGANMALRRQIWKELGGFDEQLGVGAAFRAAEDLDMAYRVARAGYRILQPSGPSVIHYGGRGGRSASQLVRGYLLGVGAMYAKHLRCGDLFIVQLMSRDLAHYSAAIARRLLHRRSPWGVGKVLFMLKGAQQGAFKPLDRRHRLFRSPAEHHA